MSKRSYNSKAKAPDAELCEQCCVTPLSLCGALRAAATTAQTLSVSYAASREMTICMYVISSDRYSDCPQHSGRQV